MVPLLGVPTEIVGPIIMGSGNENDCYFAVLHPTNTNYPSKCRSWDPLSYDMQIRFIGSRIRSLEVKRSRKFGSSENLTYLWNMPHRTCHIHILPSLRVYPITIGAKEHNHMNKVEFVAIKWKQHRMESGRLSIWSLFGHRLNDFLLGNLNGYYVTPVHPR